MTDTRDPYPTRMTRPPKPFVRKDPIVHSLHQQRWDGPLDELALSRYERDGFLWFDGFFSRRRVEPFFAELQDMANDQKLLESEHIVADPDTGVIRSVFGMHDISTRFSNLTRDPRLVGMVRQLLGGDVYLHQSRINAKLGYEGRGFEWHSDFETWHSEDGMPRMRAVSASIMLTDNNPFNGPLMLIPGSQHWFVPCEGQTPAKNWEGSLVDQRVGVPDRGSLEKLVHQGGIQAPVGPPGSLMLFECNTLHASNRNMSPWPRANLFFVYNSIENKLEEPFGTTSPRPEFLGARRSQEPLTMIESPPAEELVPELEF